jgi:hypothetical protein
MRTYIFTNHELTVIQEYLKTGKRTVAFNKILWAIRHNERILIDVQIFLTLLKLAKTKIGNEKPRLPPGRPPKLITGIRRGLK